MDMEFVLVPAGACTLGSNEGDADELPVHEVHLDAYEIGRYPVTVAQFTAFVEATGCKGAAAALRDTGGFGNHPVTWVSWLDAVAFCAWASKVTGRQVRLPTEAEWEKAARGTDGREYPWGNEKPTPEYTNWYQNVGVPIPVGSYSPRGDSPCGAADMAGNVFEMVADWYDARYYAEASRRNPQGPSSGEKRVVRGGSWDEYGANVRAASRRRRAPDDRDAYSGFRCARSPSS